MRLVPGSDAPICLGVRYRLARKGAGFVQGVQEIVDKVVFDIELVQKLKEKCLSFISVSDV